MIIENGGEQVPEPTNAELVDFLHDHDAMKAFDLGRLGALLDRRIPAYTDELRTRDETGERASDDEYVTQGLMVALLHQVNDMYGKTYGNVRGGCSMGASVPFRPFAKLLDY